MNKFTVYFLYDNENNLLYVGKSISLRNRLLSHFSKALLESEPWKNDVDKENITICECANECDLDIYETYFINKYKPQHNKDKVFNASSTFELPYLEPNKYSLESRKPKGFQRIFIEYMDLREDTNVNDQELLEAYELENPIFKEAYEKLGRKVINSCKFNEETIRAKLHHLSTKSTETIRELLNAKYKTGDVINSRDVKAELQKIYDSLNINSKAKATDVSDYLRIRVVNQKGQRVIRFL